MKTVKMSDLLGFKDLEARTRIPSSTIRRYVERFPRYLPGRTVDRVKRFPPELVEVFQRVHALYQEGRRTEEIAGILALEAVATFDISTDATDATTIPTPAAMPDAVAYFAPILERLTAALERIAENGARHAAAVEARLSRLEAISAPSSDVVGAGDTFPQVEGEKGQEWPSTASRMPREEIVARVMELHRKGLGAGAIATRLRGDGVPTLSGRGKWGKGSVRRILTTN